MDYMRFNSVFMLHISDSDVSVVNEDGSGESLLAAVIPVSDLMSLFRMRTELERVGHWKRLLENDWQGYYYCTPGIEIRSAYIPCCNVHTDYPHLPRTAESHLEEVGVSMLL